jgi:hypothetical protein
MVADYLIKSLTLDEFIVHVVRMRLCGFISLGEYYIDLDCI